MAAIERQIVCRLAQHSGRPAVELEQELRLADCDLPVDEADLREILGTLEADFELPLDNDKALLGKLSYVRDIAVLIQGRMMAEGREPTLVAAGSA